MSSSDQKSHGPGGRGALCWLCSFGSTIDASQKGTTFLGANEAVVVSGEWENIQD